MSAVVSSRDPISESGGTTVLFGIIPRDVVRRYQSSSYEERIDASLEVLQLIQYSTISDATIPELINFLLPYSNDQNLSVAQNCNKSIMEIVNVLGPTSSEYVHSFIQVAIRQLADQRRFVCQLGQSLLSQLLANADPHGVLAELVRQASTPSPKLYSEIFRCFTNLITQNSLNPTLLLQFPYFFDGGLLSPHTNVRQSAVWCTDYLHENYPQVFEQLANLLSRDASRVIGKPGMNPSTAVSQNRQQVAAATRFANTAGGVEQAKAKSMKLNRTIALSRNLYKRPILPSGTGIRTDARSATRPVSSTEFSDTGTVSYESLSIPQTFPDEPIQSFSKTCPIKINQPLPTFGEDILDESAESKTDENYDEYSISPQPFPQAKTDNYDDRPIKSRGHYDIPDDIEAMQDLPPPPKKKRPLKKLINIDADITLPKEEIQSPPAVSPKRPRAQSDMRHISFGDLQPPPRQKITDDTPIKTAGVYNFGDDIEFEPVPIPKPRNTQLTKPRQVKRPPAKKAPPRPPSPPKAPKVKMPQLIENLRSSDWSAQNDAITELFNNTDQLATSINSNLREIVPSLLECAASLRSTLAKNALNCILKWIIAPEITFENVADTCGAGLLQLQSSSHHFIVDSSGKCFLALLDNVSINRATTICVNEHRRKHAPARAKVAEGIASLVPRLVDFSPLMKPLVLLCTDANQDVRRFAKLAVQKMATQMGRGFVSAVKSALPKNDDSKIIIEVSNSRI